MKVVAGVDRQCVAGNSIPAGDWRHSNCRAQKREKKWKINSSVLCSSFHRFAVVTGGQYEF